MTNDVLFSHRCTLLHCLSVCLSVCLGQHRRYGQRGHGRCTYSTVATDDFGGGTSCTAYCLTPTSVMNGGACHLSMSNHLSMSSRCCSGAGNGGDRRNFPIASTDLAE